VGVRPGDVGHSERISVGVGQQIEQSIRQVMLCRIAARVPEPIVLVIDGTSVRRLPIQKPHGHDGGSAEESRREGLGTAIAVAVGTPAVISWKYPDPSAVIAPRTRSPAELRQGQGDARDQAAVEINSELLRRSYPDGPLQLDMPLRPVLFD
jgi:hypothetical protein